jgi:hypothetical protein
MKPTRKEKQESKALDARISAAYHANCSGIPIPLMDIPKVFAAGRKAAAEGRDITAAVVACVEAIRVVVTVGSVSR